MQPDSPEVVLYRNNAADLALKPQQISSDYIKRSKMLLISGTALCASPSREAALLAMKVAKQQDTLVVLDIDYRAYSWTDLETASLYYQLAASLADIIIGNTEEFAVFAAINTDSAEITTKQQAEQLLKDGCQLVIVKAGEEGSIVYPANSAAFNGAVFQVTAQKPFGAGDAFAGTLLFGLLNNYSLKDAVAMGAASAAINVAGTSCTEASPSFEQLNQFMIDHGYQISRDI
jgi:5-dehydro-2-deoxygluconokinase